MRFIVDTQLPVTLARWLHGRGLDATHVLERNYGQLDDQALWDIAAEERRIVISKDVDFFILASRPNEAGRLLWVRLGNCRTSALLTILNRSWEEITEIFESGQRVVELRNP